MPWCQVCAGLLLQCGRGVLEEPAGRAAQWWSCWMQGELYSVPAAAPTATDSCSSSCGRT